MSTRVQQQGSQNAFVGWASHNRWLLGTAVVAAAVAAVSYPQRTQLFAAIAGDTQSSGLGPEALFVADQGLWLLVGMVAVMGIVGLKNRTQWLSSLIAGVIGITVSLGTSTVIKLLVQETRPCASGLVHTAAVCPAAGDYSWPSNHAVLAAAFATAIIVARPKFGWVAVPVAVAIAFGRVAEGVHYVHDVASGVALGVFVVTLIAWLLTPIVQARINAYWTAPRHAKAAKAAKAG